MLFNFNYRKSGKSYIFSYITFPVQTNGISVTLDSNEKNIYIFIYLLINNHSCIKVVYNISREINRNVAVAP